MSLEKNTREKFFTEMELMITDNGNQVKKFYKTVLLIAKKKRVNQ